MAEVYRGARLRSHDSSSSRCSACGKADTILHCTLADGSVRFFHRGCLPSGLLLHAVPHGCYHQHVPGLAEALRSHNQDEAGYFRDLDERLKKDCADVGQRLESGACGPREIGLFLDSQSRIAAQLECHVCLDKVAYRPMSTGCHVFCQHCWTSWVLSATSATDRVTVTCPACRDPRPAERTAEKRPAAAETDRLPAGPMQPPTRWAAGPPWTTARTATG